MNHCVTQTKTGTRCSRIVKDGGNTCFQHKRKSRSPKVKANARSPKVKAKARSPNTNQPHGSAKLGFRMYDMDDAVQSLRTALYNFLSGLMPKRNPVEEERPSPATKKPVENCDEHTYYKDITYEEPFVSNLNCLDLPLEQVRFILGPCAFYEFEIGGRKIYIFGEMHEWISRDEDKLRKAGATKYNSLSFSAFVHSIVTQNPTKTYDLMFETSKSGLKKHGASVAFDQLKYQFENCLDPAKRNNCAYKNLRTHYVDFRLDFFTQLKREKITSLKPAEIREYINDLLTKPGKVLKQISAIKDKRIRESLVLFFRDMDPSRGVRNAVAIMDIYAIARILRDFDSKNNGISSFTGTAQNVIYYAGAVHTANFVKFLTDYLKLKPKAAKGVYRPAATFLDIRDFLNPEMNIDVECQSFIDMGDITKTMV